MKRAIHMVAALTSLLVWCALIVTMIVNHEFWLWLLPSVLLASVSTMLGTVLLSRHWIRHKSVPSYGSIFLVPFVCACLSSFVLLFSEACRYGEWYLFTFSYWNQAKGGYGDLIISFVVFWFVCLFLAAAIVIYFQKPHDSV
jgi:hypothetical protein